MAKDISKSIRLSQEDFDFIDSYPGESFSEKLDNMIALMHVTIPQKLVEVERIDNTINAKRAEFRRLSRYVEDLKDIVTRCQIITGNLKTVDSLINKKFDDVLTLPFDCSSDA